MPGCVGRDHAQPVLLGQHRRDLVRVQPAAAETVPVQDSRGAGNANDTSSYLPPRRVLGGAINAGGNWSAIGKLTWVSNCTVDGNTSALAYAQVQGGIGGVVATPNGTYAGFALLIGFSFPGGQDIEHDPSMASDAFEITPVTGGGPAGGGLGAAVVVAIGLLIAFLFIVAILAMRSRKGSRNP